MGDTIDSYTEFKNTFIRHISNLRKCVDENTFSESVYVSKFLAKLDQDLFDKIYLKRVSPNDNEIKEIKTLEKAYSVTEEMFDAIKLFETETSKRRKIKASETASNGEKEIEANIFHYGHDKKKNSQAYKSQNQNNFKKESDVKRRTQDKKGDRHQGICMFYDPDDPTKCKYGNKCLKKHLENKVLFTEFKKLNEERNKFLSKV